MYIIVYQHITELHWMGGRGGAVTYDGLVSHLPKVQCRTCRGSTCKLKLHVGVWCVGHLSFVQTSALLMFCSCLVCLVYAIREAAAKNLKKLVEKFGAEWAQVRE